MEADRKTPNVTATQPLKRPADMDEVNDASFDSFPASDPPVWSSMRAGPPDPRDEPPQESVSVFR